MPKCERCGKEVLLPFKCNFCGKYFCVEHRLPENHNCPNMPKRLPLGPASHPVKDPYALTKSRKRRENKREEPYCFVKAKRELPIRKIVAVIVIALLGFGVFLGAQQWIPLPNPASTPMPDSEPPSTQTSPSSYATSICFEGFSLTQNETHLIIEDYTSEWAPFYYISLENGTTILHLVPHPVEEDEAVVAIIATGNLVC